MIFNKTPLDGGYTIALEPREDARGYFARTFCAREFAEHGLETNVVQSNPSSNVKAGLVRGMHFQRGEDAEVKLVRCVRGAIYAAIVDLRPEICHLSVLVRSGAVARERSDDVCAAGFCAWLPDAYRWRDGALHGVGVLRAACRRRFAP